MFDEFLTIAGAIREVKQPKLMIDACKNAVLGSVCPGPDNPEISGEQNGVGRYLSYGLGHGELQLAQKGRPKARGER
jgi:hypothetical protein